MSEEKNGKQSLIYEVGNCLKKKPKIQNLKKNVYSSLWIKTNYLRTQIGGRNWIDENVWLGLNEKVI